MKRVNFKFKSTALVLLALGLSSNLWGVDATGGSSVLKAVTSYYDLESGKLIEVKMSAANSYTNPLRVYANNTFTIHLKTGGTKITKVSIEAYSTGNYVTYTQNATWAASGTGTCSVGDRSVSSKTVSANISGTATTVTIKPSNQTRWSSITVTYEAGASTYTVNYTLDGGTAGTSKPTEGTIGTAFYVSAPTKTGYTFTGWTVTAGLNSSTAKWGTTSTPTTSISNSSTLCVNGASGNVYFKDLGSANANVTLTANWHVNKTISSISVTTAPKTNYTTCETLVVSDWKVTATYSDASTEDVTSGCTFSPANGAELTSTGAQDVTVTHTASSKQTTQSITVSQGARDTFEDNVHGKTTQYGDCNGYTIPSLSATKGSTESCEDTHYQFIGWSATKITTGVKTEPSGLLKAGGTHDADGTTYYAVWAQEQ